MPSAQGRHRSGPTDPAPTHSRSRRDHGPDAISVRSSSGELLRHKNNFRQVSRRISRPRTPRPVNASPSDYIRTAPCPSTHFRLLLMILCPPSLSLLLSLRGLGSLPPLPRRPPLPLPPRPSRPPLRRPSRLPFPTLRRLRTSTHTPPPPHVPPNPFTATPPFSKRLRCPLQRPRAHQPACPPTYAAVAAAPAAAAPAAPAPDSPTQPNPDQAVIVQ